MALLRLSLPHLSTNSGHSRAPGEAGLTAGLLWLAATTLLSSCFHPHSTLDLAAVVTLAKEDAQGLLQGSGASGPGGTAGFLRSLSEGPYSVSVLLRQARGVKSYGGGVRRNLCWFLLLVIYYHFPSFLDSLLKSSLC